MGGGGLGSPGRWRPKKRLLPELGDVGEDIITAMGRDLGKFEKGNTQRVHGRAHCFTFPSRRSRKMKNLLERLAQLLGVRSGEKRTDGSAKR